MTHHKKQKLLGQIHREGKVNERMGRKMHRNQFTNQIAEDGLGKEALKVATSWHPPIFGSRFKEEEMLTNILWTSALAGVKCLSLFCGHTVCTVHKVKASFNGGTESYVTTLLGLTTTVVGREQAVFRDSLFGPLSRSPFNSISLTTNNSSNKPGGWWKRDHETATERAKTVWPVGHTVRVVLQFNLHAISTAVKTVVKMISARVRDADRIFAPVNVINFFGGNVSRLARSHSPPARPRNALSTPAGFNRFYKLVDRWIEENYIRDR